MRPLALIVILFTLLHAAALATSVKDVRIGSVNGVTRAVVELDGPATWRVTNLSDTLNLVTLEINGVDSATQAVTFPKDDSLVIRQARVERITSDSRFRLYLKTDRPVTPADFSVQSPFRIVLELRPSTSRAPLPPPGASASQPATNRPETQAVAPATSAQTEKIAQATASASRSGSTSTTPILAAPTNSQWKRRIIIDPGHGGYHKGGVGKLNGKTVYEKQVAIAVAERLERHFLRDPRFEVRLTRREDVYMGLLERTLEASRLRGDLFISIHCNAVEGKAAQARAKGFEIWTWNSQANRSAAAKAIERLENDEPGMTNRQNNRILNRMMQDALESQALVSRRLAQAVHSRAIQHPYLRRNDRGIDSAKFKVLEIYDMPSILMELGFMTHPEEVKLLFDPKFQEDWAVIMYEGIIRYYEETDRSFPRSKTAVSSR